jgi:hypothetical protein
VPTALIGDRLRFSFSFERLGTDTAANPPIVTVIHRAPTGPEVVYTLADDPLVVINDSVGNFHADIRVLEPRRHYFRAIGEGDPELEKSVEEFVDVPESYFEDPLP